MKLLMVRLYLTFYQKDYKMYAITSQPTNEIIEKYLTMTCEIILQL